MGLVSGGEEAAYRRGTKAWCDANTPDGGLLESGEGAQLQGAGAQMELQQLSGGGEQEDQLRGSSTCLC